MSKLKKIVTTLVMVLVWGVTLTLALGTSNSRGLWSILGTGIAVNVLLAMYYSCIDRQPTSFREWLSR
ncbi:hypothetical protein [Spirosoma knui]